MQRILEELYQLDQIATALQGGRPQQALQIAEQRRATLQSELDQFEATHEDSDRFAVTLYEAVA